jgi:hypothetical protein
LAFSAGFAAALTGFFPVGAAFVAMFLRSFGFVHGFASEVISTFPPAP